jgi:hypothetical protein
MVASRSPRNATGPWKSTDGYVMFEVQTVDDKVDILIMIGVFHNGAPPYAHQAKANHYP